MTRSPAYFDRMTIRTSGGEVRVSFADALDRPWSDPVTMELRFTSLGEAIQTIWEWYEAKNERSGRAERGGATSLQGDWHPLERHLEPVAEQTNSESEASGDATSHGPGVDEAADRPCDAPPSEDGGLRAAEERGPRFKNGQGWVA